MTSFVLIGFLGLAIFIIALYYHFFGIPGFEKYQTGNLLYIVFLVAAFANINTLLSLIYRVKGKLFEIAFYQTVIPLLVLIVIFLAKERTLLLFVLGAYFIGNLLSLLLFLYGKKVSFSGHLNIGDLKSIFKKGFFLFIYNVCFTMIILSTRTIVSAYYSVEQFGFFTFAYTLANSVLLFFEAFTSIIFPKIISKLHSSDLDEVESTIRSIRINYVSFSHGLMYGAMLFFPILVYFVPKYSNSLLIINLISLTLLLYTNAFGYNSLLIARNKEKVIALNTFIALIFNISLTMILVLWLKIGYEYVIISTSFSYLLFSYLCVYSGKKILQLKADFFSVIIDCFPLRLLMPYFLTVLLLFFGLQTLMVIPFSLYVFLNFRVLKEIVSTIKKILINPNIIDV